MGIHADASTTQCRETRLEGMDRDEQPLLAGESSGKDYQQLNANHADLVVGDVKT